MATTGRIDGLVRVMHPRSGLPDFPGLAGRLQCLAPRQTFYSGYRNAVRMAFSGMNELNKVHAWLVKHGFDQPLTRRQRLELWTRLCRTARVYLVRDEMEGTMHSVLLVERTDQGQTLTEFEDRSESFPYRYARQVAAELTRPHWHPDEQVSSLVIMSNDGRREALASDGMVDEA